MRVKRIILLLLIIFCSVPLACQASSVVCESDNGIVMINGIPIGYAYVDHIDYSETDKTISFYMIFPKKEVKTFQIHPNQYQMIINDYHRYFLVLFQKAYQMSTP